MNFKEYLNEEKGTYAGVRFDKKSQDYLMSLIADWKIPNPITKDELHSTLLYSPKYLPNYKAAGNINEKATPNSFEIFKTERANVLVLLLDSDFLVSRHNELMKKHKAEYPHPTYIPHITLSYDVKDFKPKRFKPNKDIMIVEEYQEDLDEVT